jgi:hypothetical protein
VPDLGSPETIIITFGSLDFLKSFVMLNDMLVGALSFLIFEKILTQLRC